MTAVGAPISWELSPKWRNFGKPAVSWWRANLRGFQRELRARPEVWIFLVFAALLKFPDLTLPFFWDEPGVYVNPAASLAHQGLYHVLPGLHAPGFFFGHTPGFSLALALLFQLTGVAPLPARLFALAAALTSVYFCARIGERLGGRAAGLAGAVLLFTYPTFFTHSTMVLADVGLLGLGTAALFLALEGRARSYAIVATAAALTKETSLAILLPVLVLAIVRGRGKSLGWYLLPIAALFSFFLLEKLTTGHASNFPLLHTLSPEPLGAFQRLLSYGSQFLWRFQKAFRISGPALGAAVLVGAAPGGDRRAAVALLWSVALCFLAGVSLFTEINPRYLLPAFPGLCALAGFTLRATLRARPLVFAITAALVAWGFADYSTALHGPGLGLEEFLAYHEVLQVEREAARYLEAKHGADRIYANWPLSIVLANPEDGFVIKPLLVLQDPTSERDYDVLVLAEASAPDIYGKQKNVVDRGALVREASFREGAHTIEVWAKRAQIKNAQKTKPRMEPSGSP